MEISAFTLKFYFPCLSLIFIEHLNSLIKKKYIQLIYTVDIYL